jgi:hypothetical protein
MEEADSHGILLRIFDARAAALDDSRALDPDEPEVAIMTELADALFAAVCAWNVIIADVEPARRARFDARRAGALVIESVFDELLTPPACRVLMAAFDIAASRS